MRISDWSSDVCSSDLGLWRHSLQKTRRPHCGLIGLSNSINSVLVFPDEATSFWGGQCLDQPASPPPVTRSAAGHFESLSAPKPLPVRVDSRGLPTNVPIKTCPPWCSVASQALRRHRSEERRVGKEWFSTCRSR